MLTYRGMSTYSEGSASAAVGPHQLLSGARELAEGVRQAQRATWFPLLVFAAVTFAAIPVYRYGHYALTCRGAAPLVRICRIYSSAGFVYWPIALVVAYVAIAAFYVHRSQARGVETRVRPYVVAGIIIAVLLSFASLWAAHHPPVGGLAILWLHGPQSFGLFSRLVGPACTIGLALLVLARAERNRALLVFTLGYLVIVLAPITFGWVIARPTPWAHTPQLVIYGSVLLLGGLGFALSQRPARPRGT
jgi:hypothetical protein